MAFYTKNNIDRRIPKILGQIEAISGDEIETRTDLTDNERARLRTLLKKMELARSGEWSKPLPTFRGSMRIKRRVRMMF